MAQILFGFGGVTISSSAGSATFDGGVGTLTYTPIQIIKENIDWDIKSRLLGYRVTIDISELYNLISTDYIQYQNLAIILSDAVSSITQKTITVTPRYDTDLDNNIEYECILTSSFSPQDLHRLKIGQVVAMNFTCVDKQDSIPTIVSDTETTFYVDDNEDTYWDGTNEYIDEQG